MTYLCDSRDPARTHGRIQRGQQGYKRSADGLGYWRPDSASRRFRSLADRAGAKGFTLYSVRHQAATTMIDAGIDAKTVSDRLGNSVATVLSTYTRARSEADRAAAEIMGSALD